MAQGKYARIDNTKKPSKFLSTVTILAFLGVCFLGVWLMTSAFEVPDEKLDSSLKNNDELKERVSETDKDSNAKDNSSDVLEDTTKGDTNVDTESNTNLSDNQEEKPLDKFEQKIEENPEEKPSETDDGDRKPEATGTGNGESNSETDEPSKESYENSSRNEIDPFEKKSDSVESEMKPDSGENVKKSDSGESEKKPDSIESERISDSDDSENKSENPSETKDGDKGNNQTDEKVEQNDDKEPKENSGEKEDTQSKSQNTSEVFPSGAQLELLNETATQTGSFSTQAAQSKNHKDSTETSSSWKLCNVTAGPDYIPCLDNWQAIKSLKTTKHYEHRERHCPEKPPTCLVPLPEGYRRSIQWPTSREKIWYHNVPHTKLAEVKGHQNWVKVSGEYLTFPGGGTQFKHGALHYIDFIQETVPDIAWGNRSRVILDVGCGVASFGGFLFDRDVLTMSFAPKDEHEAQVQFALERGIPALSAVMGTERLPFPGRVFDIVHCARCRVPWHIEGGKLLLELNRVLRPEGYFVWSATPVYQKLPEDVEIWEAMKKLTEKICWELVAISRDTVNKVGIAIYKKPSSNECYEKRPESDPPMCTESDDPNAAWNVRFQACMHKVPLGATERGSQWPAEWPSRVDTVPYWLLSSQVGVYGKPAPQDFAADNEHWKRVVTNTYLNGLGIDWSNVRNVMDMRSVYGGFAAALRDLKIWVMNVVPVDAADTLPIIYERGLFGIYHNWCQSFSTYPRSYDLLHADHLFSKTKTKCSLVSVFVEVDRILRPEGKLIVRDNAETINELEKMAKSMQWEVRMTYSKEKEGLLCVQKSMWRPQQLETVAYAIA